MFAIVGVGSEGGGSGGGGGRGEEEEEEGGDWERLSLHSLQLALLFGRGKCNCLAGSSALLFSQLIAARRWSWFLEKSPRWLL